MSDVLQVDYRAIAELRGGPLAVVGNLPYYITSQASWCEHKSAGVGRGEWMDGSCMHGGGLVVHAHSAVSTSSRGWHLACGVGLSVDA